MPRGPGEQRIWISEVQAGGQRLGGAGGEVRPHWESQGWGVWKGSREVGVKLSPPRTTLRGVQGVDVSNKDQSLLPTGCADHR